MSSDQHIPDPNPPSAFSPLFSQHPVSSERSTSSPPRSTQAPAAAIPLISLTSPESRTRLLGSTSPSFSSSSGSDTERERSTTPRADDDMTSKTTSRQHASSGGVKKHSQPKASSSASSSPRAGNPDDWTDVTEPEERRRIQNRIAQRKFREKAREHKAAAERNSRNQEHAGSAYRAPAAEEMPYEGDSELSGLPWGGPDLRFVVARGREAASRQGSRRASDHYLEQPFQQHQLPQHLPQHTQPQSSPSPYLMSQFVGGIGYDSYQAAGPSAGSWDGRDGSGSEEYRTAYESLSPYPGYMDYDTSGGSSRSGGSVIDWGMSGDELVPPIPAKSRDTAAWQGDTHSSLLFSLASPSWPRYD